MKRLTREQWQCLWAEKPSSKPEVVNWLFEMITEAEFDVRDDFVAKPPATGK